MFHAGELMVLGGVVVLMMCAVLAGLAVGYRMGQNVASPLTAELAKHIAVLRDTSQSLVRNGHALTSIVNDHRQELPTQLLLSAEQVTRMVAALAEHVRCLDLKVVPLAKARPVPDSADQRPASKVPVTKESSSECLSETVKMEALPPQAKNPETTRLTFGEMKTLDFTGPSQEADAANYVKQRYPYDCAQVVVPWFDDAVEPDPSQAVVVRCHDVSVQGISFFWPDVPRFDRFIISLGTDTNIYMLGEIAQCKAVYMHGDVQVLVGAKYTGRHPGFGADRLSLQMLLERELVSV